MSFLEDIYAVEDDVQDLEQVVENDGNEDELRSPRSSDNDDDRDSRSEAEEEKPKRVEPPGEKKKVVRNPQATLNPKRLTGPRGIQTIEGFFKDFKFSGKGHEKEDLDMVMKKLEHWAHRLYPKYQFDDCIDRIAALGTKNQVGVFVKKIRMGMILDDVVVQQEDSDGDADVETAPQAPARDEFDILLDQQIALARSTPARPAHTDTSPFQKAVYTPRPDSHDFGNSSTPIRTNPVTKVSSVQMTEEQKSRMMKNRLIAEERRLARMKQNMINDKENVSEDTNAEIPNVNTPVVSEEPKSLHHDEDISIEEMCRELVDGENMQVDM